MFVTVIMSRNSTSEASNAPKRFDMFSWCARNPAPQHRTECTATVGSTLQSEIPRDLNGPCQLPTGNWGFPWATSQPRRTTRFRLVQIRNRHQHLYSLFFLGGKQGLTRFASAFLFLIPRRRHISLFSYLCLNGSRGMMHQASAVFKDSVQTPEFICFIFVFSGSRLRCTKRVRL